MDRPDKIKLSPYPVIRFIPFGVRGGAPLCGLSVLCGKR